MTYTTLNRLHPAYLAKRPQESTRQTNTPPTNILEGGNYFKVEMAVPGWEKDDFSLEIKDHVLWIRGNAGQATPGAYKRREFIKASFEKSFSMSSRIDTSNIQARYENGILAITLPLKAPRVIEVA